MTDVAERMVSKFQELEHSRQLHIDAVDLAVQGIAELRALDRHLVATGMHPSLVLEHHHSEDPPIEELPEFKEDDVDLTSGSEISTEPESTTPPPDSGGPTSRRRYSDQEKIEAVRLADELGSDAAAGKQLGMHGVSISNWRKAGIGKKPKSVVGSEPSRTAKQPAAHEGPMTKCSVCNTKVPLVGSEPVEGRLKALREHYKDSPDCETALRKRCA